MPAASSRQYELSTTVSSDARRGDGRHGRISAIETSVALSGGGHRAGLFGLGALLYLADAGENERVSSIASVSGGSLTNGFVANALDYGRSSGAQVRDAGRALARILAHEGTFLTGRRPRVVALLVGTALVAAAAFARYPGTAEGRAVRLALFLAASSVVGYLCLGRSLRTPWGATYGTLLAPTAVAALVAPFLVPGGEGLGWALARLAASLALLLVWVRVVLGLRGRVCVHAFRKTLFPEEGGRRPLAALDRDGLAHVLCATELQTGDQFYLSPRFVYGYQLGVARPGGLTLAEAVQASAALPGAFPPQRHPTAPMGFSYPSATVPRLRDRPRPFPHDVVLVDGGVYDNMGDEWAHGFSRRARVWPAVTDVCAAPDRLIVVNASAALRYRRLRPPWLPGAGELQALVADKDVMYDQTTAQRRRNLVARFEEAELKQMGLRGALVHIAQDPYRVPRTFLGATGALAARAERARAAIALLDQLGVSRAEWRATARANAAVPTTLAPLGGEAAARLVWHAYVLAAVNLHVLLDVSLPAALPTLGTVSAWLRGEPWE